MKLDINLLHHFEKGLDPQNLERCEIKAELIGYGEISAIFHITGDPAKAYKRMPLFKNTADAAAYTEMYQEYCELLAAAGLSLPESATSIVEIPGRPVVLYIAQQRFPGETIGNRLLHTLSKKESLSLIESTVAEIQKVWQFNNQALPALEIAVDGQISNWATTEITGRPRLCYIDTSTPFIRKEGAHMLDPDLVLQAAPVWIRWLFKWLFVDDVLNRYYDHKSVLIDLAANLYKEQLPEMVAPAVETINSVVAGEGLRLTAAEVEKYYKEDKFIWTLFLAIRRWDRWMTTNLFRRRYEFILPGKIVR